MSKSWGTLRAELRLLEHETETLLTSDAPTRAQVDAQFTQRRGVLQQLTACLEQQSKPGNKAMHLERHAEILQEHEVEARRVLQQKQEAADRRNLLGNVNEDIRKFKGNAAGEEGAMLQERDRIEHSHSMADSVLAQAFATRDEFNMQRVSLQNIGQRIQASSQKIPGMNVLLNKINTRQKRNAVILAAVMSVCMLVVFFA
ncbi:hypothetical protein BCR37DRAFT_393299 [Protomyces lactucae-debilis]|uniref:Golgi SNAP receptor complex member 1 n=1 Tax=Protomyces lactucae-debilis TaxID=2754530 RepID=A0A1Y2FDP4_PROLT|nr:uncharacterized protein BCR37DRAFT_393299 [Protomyces lactucae-debilis]ORY81436.1 hypothetical protein BCR37DRAFT_393299 [Protomyces lactucae-debilis]